MKKTIVIIITTIFTLSNSCFAGNKVELNTVNSTSSVWSKEKANNWYSNQKWLSGCNFQPSSAIN